MSGNSQRMLRKQKQAGRREARIEVRERLQLFEKHLKPKPSWVPDRVWRWGMKIFIIIWVYSEPGTNCWERSMAQQVLNQNSLWNSWWRTTQSNDLQKDYPTHIKTSHSTLCLMLGMTVKNHRTRSRKTKVTNQRIASEDSCTNTTRDTYGYGEWSLTGTSLEVRSISWQFTTGGSDTLREEATNHRRRRWMTQKKNHWTREFGKRNNIRWIYLRRHNHNRTQRTM